MSIPKRFVPSTFNSSGSVDFVFKPTNTKSLKHYVKTLICHLVNKAVSIKEEQRKIEKDVFLIKKKIMEQYREFINYKNTVDGNLQIEFDKPNVDLFLEEAYPVD